MFLNIFKGFFQVVFLLVPVQASCPVMKATYQYRSVRPLKEGAIE